MVEITFEYQHIKRDSELENEIKSNPKKYISIAKSGGKDWYTGWYSKTLKEDMILVKLNYNKERELLDVIVSPSGRRF